MKKKFLFLLFVFLFLTFVFAQDIKEIELRKIENEAVKLGELFEYKIKWGFVNVGSAKMYIKNEPEKINGREVFVCVSEARTAQFFDPIYKVRDSIQSYIDMEGIFSYKYIKVQREGPFMNDEVIMYDYNKNKMFREKKKYKNEEFSETHQEFILNELLQDPLSCLYWTRAQNLEIGKTYLIRTNSEEDIFDIELSIIGKETVTVPAGKFDTIILLPNLKGKETIFKHEGTMKIWLSNDKYKIPVKMEGKIIIGSIKATLVKYKLPSN